MSGTDLAYHLRPNKAIERNLFIALLERVGRVRNISEYEYIGFGGPMLEDYKALHASLRIRKMHSIERDENTFRRQKFNKPAAFVKLHHMESGEFFRRHQFHDKGTVVWLDYTDSASLKAQLDEFVSVASSLDCFDIVKITLNAHVARLGADSIPPERRAEARLAKLREMIADYLPNDIGIADMQVARYPTTLQRCVRNVVGRMSAREGGRYFQMLSSFDYADGQRMLTITGIIFTTNGTSASQEFIRNARLDHWPFANLRWEPPMQISVPALTAKERMRLDTALPLSRGDNAAFQAKLERHLGFQCGSSGEDLAHYARFYRAYPHFSRVVL